MRYRLTHSILSLALASAFVLATVAGAAPAGAVAGLPSTSADPQYGVLIANPDDAPSDAAAGLHLAMVSIYWNEWEPAANSFSAAYRAQVLASLATFRSQGFTIGVDLGLNDAPSWALDAPNGQLEDQYGSRSGTIDVEFSQAARIAAAGYIANVVKAIGSVTYCVLGFSTTSEAVYPARPAGQSNGWWAFNSTAQGTASGVPSAVGTAPMPGWIPGSSEWRGTAVTTNQVQQWYDWYQGALVNSLTWEMGAIRGDGFGGYLMVKLVGNGANPWVYQHRIAADLRPESYDHYGTLNGGAVYQVMLDELPTSKLVVDITSVGDGSGSPADNACQASDSTVSYESDSAVNNWSSVRWLSYLAGQHGLPVVGESTGQNSASEMAADLGLAKECNLIGFLWAFDFQLYGGKYASIENYATALGQPVKPAAQLSATSRTFMTRKAGSLSFPYTITLTNIGTGPLAVSSVRESGSGFVIIGDSCANKSVGPAEDCTVVARFEPTKDGAFHGSVNISDDSGSGSQTVSLIGAAQG